MHGPPVHSSPMFTVRTLSIAIAPVFVLTACGKPPALPPDEVIRRAVIRSNTVESVAVSLSADMHTEETSAFSGSVIVQSVIRSGGHSWTADTSFNIESAMTRGHERASGRLVLVSPGTGRTYIRLESADGVLGQLLRKSFTGSSNGWMSFGEESQAQPAKRQAPDPAMLSSYADALQVTEDLGIVKHPGGRTLYHYRVSLKSETLSTMPDGGSVEAASSLSAQGEMWIDTSDFSLARVVWNVRGVPTSFGLASLHADALFSDYDSAAQIQTPVGTAATLPLESIFAIFSS